MASVIVNWDPPPAYDECCTADDATLIYRDQDTLTEQPVLTGYTGIGGQGHQPFVHSHQHVEESPAWMPKVSAFDARNYTTNATSPGQLSATTVQVTGCTEELLPLNALIVNVDGKEVETYRCHIVFSCIVTWLFCNFLFGLMAYALASRAEFIKFYAPSTARKYGSISIIISVTGIGVTLVAIFLLVFICSTKALN